MSDVFTVSLETVFDAMSVGIGGTSRHTVLMNRAFRASPALPDEAFRPGTLVKQRGAYRPGDPDIRIAAVVAGARIRSGRVYRRTLAGHTHAFDHTHLPDSCRDGG
jgi:hypothetical protein